MQKHQPASKPASAMAFDKFKAFIDCMKGLVTIGFLIVLFVFVCINWDDLKGLVHNLKSVKFAGAEAQFGDRTYRDYENAVLPGADKRGDMTLEESKSIIARATWLLPILSQSNLLWVDQSPEYSNRERQLLEAVRINIHLLRDIGDALTVLKDPRYKFDLVVSTVTPFADNQPLKTPLSACPVYWFAVPQREIEKEEARLGKESLDGSEMNALRDAWNKRTNEGMFAGFLLAEQMQSKLPEDKRPPIIFYTSFDQPIAAICSPTITSKAFALYDSILNQLERRRWTIMEGFNPPWAPKESRGQGYGE
jgi:hypothetical protein